MTTDVRLRAANAGKTTVATNAAPKKKQFYESAGDLRCESSITMETAFDRTETKLSPPRKTPPQNGTKWQ